MQIESVKRWLSRLLITLILSAIFLYAYPSATISYAVVNLLHVAIGIVLTILLLFYLFRLLRQESLLNRLGWLSLAMGAFLGIVLIKIGTPLRLKKWLYLHIALCVFGMLLLATSWLISKGWLGDSVLRRGLGFAALALLMVGIAAGIRAKCRIGDVILSERVTAYEPAAIIAAGGVWGWVWRMLGIGGARREPRPSSPGT